MNEIFDENDLSRLREIGDVVIHDHGVVTEAVFDDEAADATIIIGQIDLPESRLRRTTALKAVFNVEGNFLPNIDYGYCFRHGIRVLSISPVFAQPVAEAALGMAIGLCRGISRTDRHFREGTEQYGLTADAEAISLYRQDVGLTQARQSCLYCALSVASSSLPGRGLATEFSEFRPQRALKLPFRGAETFK